MAAKYIHFTVERIGIGRALSDIKDMTDKIIQFTAGAYQDPSPDVRFWGKKLIILLSQHHGEFTLSTRFTWDADVFVVLWARLPGFLQRSPLDPIRNLTKIFRL